MIEWLRTKVFPEAVQAQSFGPDLKKFVSFEPNKTQGTDQFASDVVFGDVTVAKDNGQKLTESVVVKVQAKVEIVHQIFDCDAQFHNEILFYTKIIPLFRKYDTDNVLANNFPEFVYGKATNGVNPKEDVIVLKSLNKKGFKLTDERLFLDEKHVKLALETIAKYHALSLRCEADEPKAFHELVLQIKMTRRDEEPESIPENFLTLCMLRGTGPLKNDPEYADRLSDFYKHCERARHWNEKYVKPSESLNVITHGDFCRNNMMFTYGNDGDPTAVVFFDLATVKYCSPAIDISFFLSLNVSPEARRLHWDEFLRRTYYGTLSRQLDGHPAKPSFEAIELDLRKKGVYGYHLCSFFMGAVVEARSKDDWDDDVDPVQSTMENGGQKTTEYLAEIIKHMLDKSYIFDV